MKAIIDFLDKFLPGKGWRTYLYTAIAGAILNLMASKGIVIDDQLTAAVTTIVMAVLAFFMRTITTTDPGKKV